MENRWAKLWQALGEGELDRNRLDQLMAEEVPCAQNLDGLGKEGSDTLIAPLPYMYTPRITRSWENENKSPASL